MTPEEALVELGEAGCDEAVLTANAFVRALIVEPDFFTVWHLADSELRRVATGIFLDAVAAKERLGAEAAQRTADELAALGPEHDLWTRFVRAALISWQAVFEPVDFERWAFVTRARPIALDIEAVLLADVGEAVVSGLAECEGDVRAIPLVMRRTEAGYRVAGVGLDQSHVD